MEAEAGLVMPLGKTGHSLTMWLRSRRSRWRNPLKTGLSASRR